MASQKKPASNVTRIKATSSKTAKPAAKKTTQAHTAKATSTQRVSRRLPKSLLGKLFRPFVLMGGYFKGAWVELRQVRWPNRQATWSLTVAVLLFTAFFTVLILLLDAAFKYLFELMIA